MKNSIIAFVLLLTGGVPAVFVAGLPAVFLAGCRKEAPPQPYVRSIDLEALDASCTEAWLRVRFTDSAAPRAFALKRDGQTILSALNSPPDTLVIDEGLLPNRTYTYKAYRLEVRGSGFQVVDSSTQATVTTMDTTSHNFTWQIDTLGDGGGSVLYDVAIINDTLAYAVGEIYKRDSLGNWDPQPYGLAIWNGRSWSLRKIMVVSQQGDVHSRVLRGIYAFSATDVWFGDGNAFHWDGQSTFATAYWISGYPGNPTPVLGPNQGVHKFWGTSGSNLYGVGVNGGIAHYDGVRWRRIESGTTQEIQDIYGVIDSRNADRSIYCAASHTLGYGERKILSITQSNTVDTVEWAPQRTVLSLWAPKRSTLYTCGAGVFRRGANEHWKEIAGIDVIPVLTEHVRGNDVNDYWIVGHFGAVAHFNGTSFQLYPEVGAAQIYFSCDQKNNLFVAVGMGNGKGIILRMWR